MRFVQNGRAGWRYWRGTKAKRSNHPGRATTLNRGPEDIDFCGVLSRTVGATGQAVIPHRPSKAVSGMST
jgi:hypothetical protein